MIIQHKKNTAFELAFPMVDSVTPASFKTGLFPTDTGYYKDGAGAWTVLDIVDTATQIGTTGVYEISLTAAELNYDWVVIKFSAAGAADTLITFKLFVHSIDDVVNSNNRVDVGSWLGSAVTLSTANKPDVNIDEISDDIVAPGNLELMFDGTGYAGGTAKLDVNIASQNNIDFGALQKTSLNAATPASVVGSVGSVTGAVGSVTAGVIVTMNNDKTGYGLSTVAIQAVWDALTSAFTTVGSIGKKLADWVVGTIDTYTGNTKQTGDSFVRLGAPIGVSVSVDIAAIKSDTVAILADTGTDGVVVNDLTTAAKALIQIETEDALVAKHLDHLVTRQGMAQAGGVNTITLDTGASSTNNLYNGQAVLVVGGTGAGQARKIESYNGTTKVATVDSNWAIQPISGSEFIILDIYILSGTGATAQQIWEYATRALTDKIGFSLIADQSGVTIGTVNTLGTQAKADVNAEVDSALNTVIPINPTSDSVNERVKTIDDKLPVNYIMGSSVTSAKDDEIDTIKSDVAAILVDTGTEGVIVNSHTIAAKVEIQTEVEDGLIAKRLNELMVTALGSQPTTGSLMGDLTEDDGGTQRFTVNALEQAPVGGGGAIVNINHDSNIIVRN